MMLNRLARGKHLVKGIRRYVAARTLYAATRDAGFVLESQRMLNMSTSAFRGWFTGHPTRYWEYPWVWREAKARAGRVSEAAADYGAGKSPMPLALSRSGYRVTVVDPAQLETMEGKSRGNEWDFVDYSRWGIPTHRAGMEAEVFAPGSIGLAVSVSVIEHLPAQIRREGLARVAQALEDGGCAIMTADLCRGTRLLWNRVVEEIEPEDVHGTLDDLLAEAAAVNLKLERFERCPIRTDALEVVGMVFTKN